MSRSNRATVQVLAGVGLLALGTAAFFMLYERVPVDEPVLLRGEPAVNPYYALEAMLDAMGVEARSVANLREPPPRDHVLFLGAPTRGRGRFAVSELIAWVEGGGHLVVVPTGAAGEDPLLEALGVTRFMEDEADDDDAEATSPFESERPAWPKLWAEDATVLRSDGPADAAWLLTVPIGQGAATVLSDGAFLSNLALGAGDHALIAWNAIAWSPRTPSRPPKAAVLVYRDPAPSLFALFTRRAGPFVVSLAVLALAALLAAARRHGPIAEVVPVERRHLAEHVRAAGSYLWSVDAAQALLEPMREAVRRNHAAPGDARDGGQSGAQRDHALVERLTEGAARADGDALGASLDPLAIRKAFSARGEVGPQEFVRIVRTLEILRRSS